MISEGKLDKYGRKNDSTPMNWLESYKSLDKTNEDVNGSSGDAVVKTESTIKKEKVILIDDLA